MAKHLHGAQLRLEIGADLGRESAATVGAAANGRRCIESKLADLLRPRLVRALDEVGLRPRNVPERVVLKTLIEELLDQIVDRGYLTMGDLRDAISPTLSKPRDVAGVREFFTGEQLLQANQHLAKLLDGVYRPGERYLRLPQMLRPWLLVRWRGRFLTRYVIVPFGGAVMVLGAIQHLCLLWAEFTHREPVELLTPTSVLLLGTFLLGLLYHPSFRRNCLLASKAVFHALRGSLSIFPARC